MAGAGVTVSVAGGPSATVPWNDGMTVQDALEAVYHALNTTEQFTFALQFFGPKLGYLVIMINETYDSFISKGGGLARPFFYWQFLVNDQPATGGVSTIRLAARDHVRFEFEMYAEERHEGTTVAMKHKHQTGG